MSTLTKHSNNFLAAMEVADGLLITLAQGFRRLQTGCLLFWSLYLYLNLNLQYLYLFLYLWLTQKNAYFVALGGGPCRDYKGLQEADMGVDFDTSTAQINRFCVVDAEEA